MTRDPWAVLGLPETATWDEVRAAHRRLAKVLHPDAGVEADHRRMAELNEALATLAARFSDESTPAEPVVHAAPETARPGSFPPADESVAFSIDLLPVEAFEALLIVTSFLGDPWVIDEPYELTVLLDPPLASRCNLWLVPEAGGSIVTIDVHPVPGHQPPTGEAVRDALIAELQGLDGPPR